jgi:hypothetical protein
MATWQINIERKQYAQPVNMDEVRAALGNLIADIEQVSGQGRDLDESVMVAAGDVGSAVEIINALGYATDEDN